MLLNYPFFHYGSISVYIMEQKFVAAVVTKVQKYQLLGCVPLFVKNCLKGIPSSVSKFLAVVESKFPLC